MKTTANRAARRFPGELAPLQNGDRLSQPEFHRLYAACPEGMTFELVAGTVYMASPLGYEHARFHVALTAALLLYENETPGIELLDNPTIILGPESEPQPDIMLRILPECGGRTHLSAGYVAGAPEFVAEIASSSRAIDLHQKRQDYQRAGIQEYLVISLREPQLSWFHFPSRRQIRPDGEGVYRSHVFPGLWIHGRSLLALKRRPLLQMMRSGLRSPGHERFVRRLASRRRG